MDLLFPFTEHFSGEAESTVHTLWKKFSWRCKLKILSLQQSSTKSVQLPLPPEEKYSLYVDEANFGTWSRGTIGGRVVSTVQVQQTTRGVWTKTGRSQVYDTHHRIVSRPVSTWSQTPGSVKETERTEER
ncbi:hypothetical protein WMY93_032189 [Mugilogobius chulae]|uniref:Uncharacterized protein n=1 Tax=Mugilogobius chulae TaxID=88201 RepID=A0AAW0MEJ6_9GOBI